jgi:hypothetical protein
MTKIENVVASYMEQHNCNSILLWNYCLLNYERLEKIWVRSDLFYDINLFEELKTKAENDMFNKITCANGKFMRVDKSNLADQN